MVPFLHCAVKRLIDWFCSSNFVESCNHIVPVDRLLDFIDQCLLIRRELFISLGKWSVFLTDTRNGKDRSRNSPKKKMFQILPTTMAKITSHCLTSWWRECCLSWLSSDCNVSFFTDHCSCMPSNDVWRPSTSFCEAKKNPVGRETWPPVSFLMEKIQNLNRKKATVPLSSVFATKNQNLYIPVLVKQNNEKMLLVILAGMMRFFRSTILKFFVSSLV